MAGAPSRDSLWPTAAGWLTRHHDHSKPLDVAVIGMPSSARSISATQAHLTPAAVREALRRYSTWSADRGVDFGHITNLDFGDISNPDAADGFERSQAILRSIAPHPSLTAVLGGDNSITYPTMLGLYRDALSDAALITFDAHHDLRDGWSNGSPVRQLIEAGLPGANIVQIGIAGFANSRAYYDRARDYGIHIITREECHRRSAADVIDEAMSVVGDRPTHIDVDVDVCDRSVAPGCPASSPGGVSAQYLRDLVHHASRRSQVRSLDITEVDAAADAPDGRTVRLAALCLLEAVAGLAVRPESIAAHATHPRHDHTRSSS